MREITARPSSYGSLHSILRIQNAALLILNDLAIIICSMTTEQLQKLHQLRPFQPFAICLGDGQRLLVRHPEMLSYAPKSRTAVVYRSDGSFEIVDLLLVTGLDVQPPHNGSRRHKRLN